MLLAGRGRRVPTRCNAASRDVHLGGGHRLPLCQPLLTLPGRLCPILPDSTGIFFLTGGGITDDHRNSKTDSKLRQGLSRLRAPFSTTLLGEEHPAC